MRFKTITSIVILPMVMASTAALAQEPVNLYDKLMNTADLTVISPVDTQQVDLTDMSPAMLANLSASAGFNKKDLTVAVPYQTANVSNGVGGFTQVMISVGSSVSGISVSATDTAGAATVAASSSQNYTSKLIMGNNNIGTNNSTSKQPSVPVMPVPSSNDVHHFINYSDHNNHGTEMAMPPIDHVSMPATPSTPIIPNTPNYNNNLN